MIPSVILLEKGASTIHADVGEILFHEDSMALFYYQVLNGRVRLSNFLSDGREVLHNVICANEGFGEVAILDNGLNTVTAIADSSCTLLKISSKKFFEIMHEYGHLHHVISQKIARELHFKLFMIKLIYNRSPEEILSNLIHKLNESKRLVCQECNRLMLTRQQLANMTGLRVETIIRTMKQMEKDDKLNIVRGKVFVPADGID
ncbi:Crp/Fnr family transcriptional regulator [Sphingobacterium sp. 2149]|uniref:Crp/Fnr family transcriptional regulator n=1 Tax=Sphingobacterium sp. 2149 TaxID=2817763 RepID=UPI0028550934|nr:Crp/Fnr family transcriptional regulator [Sphingobacterium sp. 2149]MDR6735021.1 CRP-like cAMP-binding protein [Sphingobacterium sp. 2149]